MRVLLSFQLDHWALFQGVLRVLQGLTSVQQQLVMSLSSEMSAGWVWCNQTTTDQIILPRRWRIYVLVDHNGWEEEVPLGHATEAANGVHRSGWLPIARHVSFISRHLPLHALPSPDISGQISPAGANKRARLAGYTSGAVRPDLAQVCSRGPSIRKGGTSDQCPAFGLRLASPLAEIPFKPIYHPQALQFICRL
ncbi:hypothetical protein PGT21_013282 [Puccinia graminis f. sp. tritici]|uniref:Uncharacterized protein n=1 Tax=Puccinia graminis f. sp. tritici TaxID=56615 RepID=A0A5B0NJ23_PUCGR|nr:hypothetical protein PGT21_013282 [Puccinia graminis f. sp. tritici]